MTVRKIVSGGQTGVDRAALDCAIELGIPHGGWCPAGRKAEDGPIPEKYNLRETDSARYDVRTKRNVKDSDGTLIASHGPLTGGTLLTVRTAERLGRPVLIVDLQTDDSQRQLQSVLNWLESQQLKILNVAGPRESTCPGITKEAFEFLQSAFAASKRKSLP